MSFFVYYSIWIINLCFKVIQVLFFFVREIICKEHAQPKILFYTPDTSRNIPDTTILNFSAVNITPWGPPPPVSPYVSNNSCIFISNSNIRTWVCAFAQLALQMAASMKTGEPAPFCFRSSQKYLMHSILKLLTSFWFLDRPWKKITRNIVCPRYYSQQ